MPTILRIGRYRVFFFSNEGDEPVHIHIDAGNDQAKFRLNPIQLAHSYGFRAHDLNRIAQIIHEHQAQLLEAWHEHFG